MTDHDNDPAEYKVGYKNPPKHTQFKKGQSGNPKGRRPRPRAGEIDINNVLNKSVTVKMNGKEQNMQPFEAIFRKAFERAMNGHVPSICRFIQYCERYDVLAPPDTCSGGGVLQAPRGVDFYEWVESILEPIPEDEG